MRKHGMDRVAVADIMRGAGLTHGGFYAHFTCRDDLLAQSVTQIFADGAARTARWLDAVEPPARLERFIEHYLSPAHRDMPERGCPLTTISTDMPRQPDAARQAFDAGLAAMFGRVAALMPQAAEEDRAALARSVLSEMAGAVALSRAAGDRAQSDAILAAARRSVRRRCGLEHPITRQESAGA